MSEHPLPAPGPRPETREGVVDETSRASSHVAATPPPSQHHPHRSHSLSQSQHSPDSPSHNSGSGHQNPARNVRKLVLDSTTSPERPPSIIRRKPVSSTASPVATRYSHGSHLASARNSSASVPANRFSRAFSVESPTLYEFPEPPSIASVAGLGISTPAGPNPHVTTAQDNIG